MAEIKSSSRRWEGMETDGLVRWEDMVTDGLVTIFKKLKMIELASVALVCRAWRSACSDPLLWNTLDLGLLKSNFMQIRVPRYIWADGSSDKELMEALEIEMRHVRGIVTCLIFYFNLCLQDEHLSYVAKSCPHLRRLVMPAWSRLTKNGICDAFRKWEQLESLTMPTSMGCIADPSDIMEEISRSCKNFSQLKLMCAVDLNLASAIATHLPNLRVLSVRCSVLTKEALLFILDRMDHLEVLNMSHCLLLENLNPGKQKVLELDGNIRAKTARLREFFHCQSRSCIACDRMIRDDGLMRWWKYEDWFWREDEISSLALGNYC